MPTEHKVMKHNDQRKNAVANLRSVALDYI